MTGIEPSRISEVAEYPNEEELSPAERGELWKYGLALVPPDDIRGRIKHSRSYLDRDVLAYIGDSVWEYCVLKHQYKQYVRSPWTESQAVRALKQAKAAVMLYRGKPDVLTYFEKDVLDEGMTNKFREKVKTNYAAVEQIGIEQYNAACGLRSLLGYLYMDADASEERLETVLNEIGLLSQPGEEDAMLSEITDGIWDPVRKGDQNYFLALAPLGHVALRLYVSRYLAQRPPRPDEFIYRVKMALRQEELDVAAEGFMRDEATETEIALMKGARDRQDTYAFAFECLLGHLAMNFPYRLHQVLSSFGWADPLPGTFEVELPRLVG